ncbi:hypothetical protein U3516DRAFT_907946 [Neocallimastix sp. 'constans']|jgi:hypothetical protein
MKLILLNLLNIFTTALLVKADAVSNNNAVHLETYYNGELYPYICSQKCKSEYEKYQGCFNSLDNEFFNLGFPELCNAYKNDKCKKFLEDIVNKETSCSKGTGPQDFDVHDEITMNKIFYLASCSIDAKGNYCNFSQHIHKNDYDPINLFHMKKDVNETLSVSCSSHVCRENLVNMLEHLVPLYEHDVSTDNELSYESEFIENGKRSITYLTSEACVSQDPVNPVIQNQNQNLSNGINTLNIIPIMNLIIISLLSLLLKI